jgi:hypothetical protein
VAQQTIRVEGLRELQRALRNADKELAKDLTRRLKEAADIVRQDAASKFASINPVSAAGFRPRARTGVAAVEQSKKRTTGTRPDFGSLQMRVALLPALADNTDNVVAAIDRMLDELGQAEGF